MLKKILQTLLAAGAVMSGCGTAYAREASDASLADMIYMGVSVASKKVETLTEAPGIISVITADDIRQLAAKTLYDILATVPGVTVTESFFGYTSISFRGIKETHYNNRTLLLLNGHALRDVIVGTHWLEMMPAQVIDRIEIIRGPGSVIYGTGAFSGVISVVTKKSAGTELGMWGGSENTLAGFGTLGRTLPGYRYLAGASCQAGQGYPALVKDEAGVSAQMGTSDRDPNAYQDNFYNVFGNLGLDDLGLEFNAYHFNQDKDKFGLIPDHQTAGEVNNIASGADCHYRRDFSGVGFQSLVYYDQNRSRGYIQNFPPNAAGTPLETSYSGYKFGADVDAQARLLENLSLLSGAAFEYQKANPYEWKNPLTHAVSPFSTFLREYDTNDFSVYSQLEYQAWAPLKILAGVRYNFNRDYGGTVVPRISTVLKLDEELSLKLLYGSAYRNPTFFEKYVNTQNVLYGNPALTPEKINTAEIGLDAILKPVLVRLTGFYLATDDMIGRVITYTAGDIPAVTLLESRGAATTPTRPTPGYGNAEGQNIYGSEFELQTAPWGDALGVTVNFSYKDGLEKAGQTRIQYLDKWTGKAELKNLTGPLASCLTFQYVGPRTGSIDAGVAAPGFTPGQEMTVPAYCLTHVKIAYQAMDWLEVSLMAMNVFAQQVAFPEFIRRRTDVIPGDSGRNLFGEARLKF